MDIKNRWDGSVLFSSENTTLREAVLEAVVKRADLRSAYLRSAYLRSADLSGADLSGAYLSGADLRSADLRSADLRSAYLSGAYLSGADLSGANLPSPTALLLASWGEVSTELCADLMLFDAACHPDPAKFDAWAQGGVCPYAGVKLERAANFREVKELWGKGQACRPFDLMSRLIAEKCPEWSDERRATFEATFKKAVS